MTVLDAYHLPGGRDARSWRERRFRDGALVLRSPALDAAGLDAVWNGLAEAGRDRLRGGSAETVPAALARAARRMVSWTGDSPWSTALAEESGLSEPALAHALEGMAHGWSEASLTALLTDAFGTPWRPTAFVSDPTRPGVRTLPRAPAVAFHRFAGNVPGVGVTAAIRSLLVGSAVFARTSASGTLLPALFGRALAEEDEALGRCFAAVWWPTSETVLDAAAMARTTLVVAYGGGDAMQAIRALAPSHVRLVLHGPAVSVGVIFARALAGARVEAVAREAALAITTFEQRGCTSPLALLVQRGGEIAPGGFASLLGRALASLAARIPPGPADVSVAARRRAVLDTAALRAGAEGAGPYEGDAWGVWESADVRPEDFCTGRLVQVVPFEEVPDLLELLRPLEGRLQTVGLAGAPASSDAATTLAHGLANLGASRVTGLPEMPWPPATWRHDGRDPLRELVSWTDLEGPSDAEPARP